MKKIALSMIAVALLTGCNKKEVDVDLNASICENVTIESTNKYINDLRLNYSISEELRELIIKQCKFGAVKKLAGDRMSTAQELGEETKKMPIFSKRKYAERRVMKFAYMIASSTGFILGDMPKEEATSMTYNKGE